MADLTLKSERQIQTQILATLIAELGLNDINPGSVLDVLTQAVAQQDFALYYQIAQVSRLADIEALTGDDLDLKAFEYGLTRVAAAKTRGLITIQREEGFEKVSTTFYAGLPAPIAGDTTINVNDASNVLIGTSGTLILGRGTNNEEEVDYSVAPVDNTNYWTFTLDSALSNDHAVEETVILKQGSDEVILAGTIVVVPATGTTEEIQFELDNDVTLLAGEAEVAGVEVTALEAGTDGNITANAISGVSAFPSPPFTDARATNPAKFTTGLDQETDDELRDRIKDAVQALSKGVKSAILNAIVGLVDTATAKRVVSASVVLPVEDCGPVKVYIDDGTGFEPTFESQGFETIRADSTGGEQRLQLDIFPIQKAQVENNTEEFYDMSSGALTLEYRVGTQNETITFNPADFRSADIATAEEIAEAINNKASLVEARTSQSGTFVNMSAVTDTNESIQVIGGTANVILNFPTDLKETLNLYVDDVKLSKDGETAFIDSQNAATYDLLNVGAYPHTLTVVVDGKTANTQTATINLVDVADSAAVTAAEIITVLNRDLAGVTASAINSGTRVRLTSNTELSSGSKINVTGGTMNDASDGLNFDTTEVEGVDGDYTFNRELGIVELTTPLGTDQTVTAGSQFTRAKLRASSSENYAPLTGETLVISVDGGGDQTVTFDASFAAGKSAQLTADFINDQLVGATAIVRTIGGINFLEINTNTYDTAGTIEIKGTSTANAAFGFTLDTEVSSTAPNRAFKVSSNAGPYEFAEADSLVVVVDDDIVNNTFSILMNVSGSVTTPNSTTMFRDSSLTPIFDEDDELIDFYLAFTSGANTTSGTITTVANVSGDTWRYTFSVAPPNFGDYAIGDLVNISGLDESGNNGNFVITAIGATTVDVTNADAEAAALQSGTGVLSQRRQITDYTTATGEITVGSAFTNAPSGADPFIVIPSTINNLVDYISNTKITSFTLKGAVEGVENNTKLQLSSDSLGSDGYIQITGGNANDKLGFDTSVFRGIQAYNYWVGLTRLVHKTIYGDDTDLTSFPGVGAAGVIFQVLAPTTLDVQVELDVTLREGVSIASLENEIKSAVSGYINNLGVGDDVVIEEIRAAVIAISGITDVTLSEPSANIPIADNELARVSDPNILIG